MNRVTSLRLLAILFSLSWLSLALPPDLFSQPPKPAPTRPKSKIDDESEDKPADKPATPNTPKPTEPAKPNLPTLEPEKPIQGIEKGPFNLTEEAEKATHPAAKALFTTFAKPADVIVFRSAQAGEKELLVEPLAKMFDSSTLANIDYTTMDGGRKGTLKPDQVIRIDPYEARVLAGVKKFLDQPLDKAEGGQAALSRFQMLRAAEKVLTEAHSFHTKAIDLKQRVGDNWAALGKNLDKDLVLAQVAQVRALTADQEWSTAQALASRLYNERPGERELLATIETLHVNQANDLINKKAYFQARKLLEQLKGKYRVELAFDHPVQKRLVDYAREKFDAGKKLIDEGKRTDALKLLEEAAQAWPALPGLEVYVKGSNQEYPVLRVGVRHLPQQLAPTTAASAIDRIASRLVFDPLLEARFGPMLREGYASKIGDEPRRVEQGWELDIPAYLKWSDGTPVTSADFVRSGDLVAKLDPKLGSPVYDPDAADLLTITAPDQRRVLFSFRRATLDPLAYLNFSLVPASRLPADRSPRDPAFGKAPVGTGPFVFEKMDGEEMVFLANPNYVRPWAPTGPIIKEVRFIKYTDFAAAKQALAEGRWQMLLDLTTAEKEELTGLAGTTVITPTEPRHPTLPTALDNPRIWFLGFNYRKEPFQSDALRRAVGLGINRDGILASVFRGKGRPYHQTLTQPFPNGSWAVPETAGPGKVQGNQPSQATNLLNQAKQAGGLPATLNLYYAQEDLGADRACAAIKADLEKVGFSITLKGMPAVELKADLESERPTFDLVYASYDFPSELLSLWPLFDPSSVSPIGQNFMGDCKDTALISIFRSMQNKRDFDFIRRRNQEISDAVWRKMHLAPLWQLDPHIAVHRSLSFERLHPTFVFEDVEKWKLRKE